MADTAGSLMKGSSSLLLGCFGVVSDSAGVNDESNLTFCSKLLRPSVISFIFLPLDLVLALRSRTERTSSRVNHLASTYFSELKKNI